MKIGLFFKTIKNMLIELVWGFVCNSVECFFRVLTTAGKIILIIPVAVFLLISVVMLVPVVVLCATEEVYGKAISRNFKKIAAGVYRCFFRGESHA